MTKFFTKEGDDYKEVEAFSQEAVTGIVEDRLKRERTKYADYDEIKTKAATVDTLKTEYETKVGDLTTQLGSAKLETEKVKIVNEFKLPDELHEFVTGTNADEMRTRAEKLSKGVKPEKVVIDKKPKPGDEKSTDSKVLAGRLFGKKSD